MKRLFLILSVLYPGVPVFAQDAPLPWQIEGDTLETLRLRIDLSGADTKTPEAAVRSFRAAQRGLEAPAIAARLEAAVRHAREAVIARHLDPGTFRALGGGKTAEKPAALPDPGEERIEILDQAPAEGGRIVLRARETTAAGERVRRYTMREAKDDWRIESREVLCAYCDGGGKKRLGPRKGEPCVKCAGAGYLPDDPVEPLVIQGRPGAPAAGKRGTPADAVRAYVVARETELPALLVRLYDALAGPLRALADRFFDEALRARAAAALAMPQWEDPVPALAPDQTEGETADAAIAFVRMDYGPEPAAEPGQPAKNRLVYRRLTLAKAGGEWRIRAIEDACRSCGGKGICSVCAESPGKIKVQENGKEKTVDCPACKGIPICRFCQGKGLKAIRSLEEF